MRNLAILLAATSLAACGNDAQSVASTATLPTTAGTTGTTTTGTTTTGSTTTSGGSGSSVTSGSTGTTTTTSGGTGAGVTAGTTTVVLPSGFLTITAAKTYQAVGAFESLKVSSTSGTLYQGNASTVRAPSGTVAYDPRDGIFTLTLSDNKAGISSTTRFQDPAHRTGTGYSSAPDLQNFNYLQAIGTTSTDLYTMFYQRPGSATTYVSLAGYTRDNIPADPAADRLYERGAFVFGDLTPTASVPITGTGTYNGGFLAAMVNNPSVGNRTTYHQWVFGSSTVTVDFAKLSVALSLAGTVDKAYRDGAEVLNVAIPAGSTFAAVGSATIDLTRTGGFTGTFNSAGFTVGTSSVPVQFSSVSPTSSTAGASSIDGAFYGPTAVNVGGNFRIIGGVPDQRVDITGAFVGTKGP